MKFITTLDGIIDLHEHRGIYGVTLKGEIPQAKAYEQKAHAAVYKDLLGARRKLPGLEEIREHMERERAAQMLERTRRRNAGTMGIHDAGIPVYHATVPPLEQWVPVRDEDTITYRAAPTPPMDDIEWMDPNGPVPPTNPAYTPVAGVDL